MPYKLYVVAAEQKAAFDALGIPVSGTLDELLDEVDIVLDASPGGTRAQEQGDLPGQGR